jgi:protein O-GlcNAc transferase
VDPALERARQLVREGKLEQAEAALRRLVTRPGTMAMVELARVLRLRGNQAAAEQFAMMAFGRAATHEDIHAVGALLDSFGLHARAIEAFRKGIKVSPASAGMWNGLGLALLHANEIEDAIAAFERARDLSPRDTTIQTNLAWARSQGWRLDEALDAVRRIVADQPSDVEARKLLVFLLNYSDLASPSEVFEAHVPFGEHFSARAAGIGLPTMVDGGVPATDRPLRVGLMSPDLREHPVARFIEPLLAGRDRSRMELHCYSIAAVEDATTARLRGLADGWTVLTPMSDVDAALRVRADNLDVLVDLNGHTAGGRPGILALRGARKQVTYLGYPHTTGLATMDARLIDAITDPLGFEAQATEELVRLEPCFLCFAPTAVAREVPPHPVSSATDESRPVTFGSFNTLRKLTPRMLETWCGILKRVPQSRLLLKNAGVGSVGVGRLVLETIVRHGVDPSRVEMLGRMKSEEDHYRAYHRVDIALDCVPYNGTTTTCDALWMGVPVVTMLGDRHVSRVSASLLNAVGTPELVAKDVAGYVELAVALAADRARLDHFHATLRDRMQGGVLCDGARFARAFERAMREIVSR